MGSLLLSKIYKLYSGTGNNFIICEDVEMHPELVRSLCSLESVDGLIVLTSSSVADIRMIIYNLDGFEASMCGNGLRCVVAYMEEKLNKCDISVETQVGVYRGKFVSLDKISIDMTLPEWHLKECFIPLTIEELIGNRIFYVHTGVPHVVVMVDRIGDIDVMSLGKLLRNHPYFMPEGVNVNFISFLDDGQDMLIRTYERGVEAETGSCGTGTIAAALVAKELGFWENSINFFNTKNERLKVFYDDTKSIWLEGSVRKIEKENQA